MRISDWSSDVCSSDLLCLTISERTLENPVNDVSNLRSEHLFFDSFTIVASSDNTVLKNTITYDEFCDQPYVELLLNGNFRSRSEEHTSELQSLMRISYAVFSLKKKKK